MALQLVDAMAPFAGAGIIDMSKLAAHVLQFGFGVKNPDDFLAQPQQQAGGTPPVPAPAGAEAPSGAPAPAGEPAPDMMAMLQQGQPPTQ
jgi:hypothetical protein